MEYVSIKSFLNKEITKNNNKKHNKVYDLLVPQEVLRGITDIIGVYKTDRTVIFYNQAGYDFHNSKSEEVIGKKCYEVLGGKKPCYDCHIDKAIQSKQILRVEKNLSKFDKVVECCYNPIIDDSGEVIFVVEQLRDITEKKKLENSLKESEERYRKIVSLSPDPIVITVDGKIVFANRVAEKYFDNPIGEGVYKYSPGYEEILNMRMSQIIKNKTQRTCFDYKVVLSDKSIIDIEACSSYLFYRGQDAIITVIRDITKRKKGLDSAAKVQKRWLKSTFPLPEKVDMETVYKPAKTVSGDFFAFKKVNENLVIGIIVDVSGKGISAGLNISAFNVLFHEAVLKNHSPAEIIANLNEKVVDYLGERYIAACCFSLDFKNYKARVVGAGINQFIHKNQKDGIVWKTVKGPFLGMFEDSTFDEEIINFKPGDKFYFFTDGLEDVLDEEKVIGEKLVNATICEFKNYINNYLNDMLKEVEGIKDDCTLLALDIK